MINQGTARNGVERRSRVIDTIMLTIYLLVGWSLALVPLLRNWNNLTATFVVIQLLQFLVFTALYGGLLIGIWFYDWSREDKWRYFLITSLFNSLGSREIYLRLNEALKKQLSERETREFHLFIGGPKESLVNAVRAAVTTDIYASVPRTVPVNLDRERTKAIVYRLADPADARRVRLAKARFRKLSNEMRAA